MGVGAGVTAFTTGGLVIERMSLPAPKKVELGGVKVSIHLPVINEEGWIEDTLISLVNQPLYKKGGVKLVILDSHSTDRTVEIAERYADAVLDVPKGKISARDAGIRWDDADIIVAVDSADFYPQGWLSCLLEPFSNLDVVATHGSVLSRDLLYKAPVAWSNLIRPSTWLSGRNSAFRREAYVNIGGFDLSVDQFDRGELQNEEEVKFLARMKNVGKVVFVWNASIFRSERMMPVTLEMDGRIEKYKREIAQKVRF